MELVVGLSVVLFITFVIYWFVTETKKTSEGVKLKRPIHEEYEEKLSSVMKTIESYPKYNIDNVGEPCISFVNLVKSNRKRFAFGAEVSNYRIGDNEYYLVDKVTQGNWVVSAPTIYVPQKMLKGLDQYQIAVVKEHYSVNPNDDAETILCCFHRFPSWMNSDEQAYVFFQIKEFMKEAVKPLTVRKQQLRERASRDYQKNLDKERQKYIDVYCKGEL